MIDGVATYNCTTSITSPIMTAVLSFLFIQEIPEILFLFRQLFLVIVPNYVTATNEKIQTPKFLH